MNAILLNALLFSDHVDWHCGTIGPQILSLIGDIMPVALPVREMKNTAQFAERVRREREVLVTRNGVEVMTCVSADQRKAELEEISKAKLLSRILMAEGEYARGEYENYDDFAAKMRLQYGL